MFWKVGMGVGRNEWRPFGRERAHLCFHSVQLDQIHIPHWNMRQNELSSWERWDFTMKICFTTFCDRFFSRLEINLKRVLTNLFLKWSAVTTFCNKLEMNLKRVLYILFVKWSAVTTFCDRLEMNLKRVFNTLFWSDPQ